MAKKYVPDGACLVCNKGVGFGKLKVTNHKNVSIYGQNSATEGDKVSKVNIPALGVCTITRSVCQPVPLLWSGVQEGVTIGPYRKLLEDSELSCGIGWQISIYFSVPMAMIAVEKNSREQGKNEVKKLGARVDDWFKKQFDNAEKMNNAMPGSTIENFKLGVAEGVYGGVKGIGEGLMFLSDLKDKAFDATVDAVTHPTETATAIGQAATNAKDAVVKAKDWVSNTDNLKRVANSVEETSKDAYNWTTTPGNLEKAAQAGYNNSVEKLKQAKAWAGKQKPRDWGNYTGRGGFEAALMFTGVGEAKAVVNGAEVANVAAKTGEAANLASKVGEGANLAEKTAEGANLASKASEGRALGEVVSHTAEEAMEAAWKKKWAEVFDQKNIDEAYERYKAAKLAKKQVPRSKEAWFKGNKGRGGYESVLKGQMGEYQADQYMASKGYTKLNHDGKLIDPLDPARGRGIDGIWHDPGPPPKYIISETKYGSSKLTKEQMSDEWIDKNLEKAVKDRKTYDAIGSAMREGNVEKQLLNVDKNGKIITTILK